MEPAQPRAISSRGQRDAAANAHQDNQSRDVRSDFPDSPGKCFLIVTADNREMLKKRHDGSKVCQQAQVRLLHW